MMTVAKPAAQGASGILLSARSPGVPKLLEDQQNSSAENSPRRTIIDTTGAPQASDVRRSASALKAARHFGVLDFGTNVPVARRAFLPPVSFCS